MDGSCDASREASLMPPLARLLAAAAPLHGHRSSNSRHVIDMLPLIVWLLQFVGALYIVPLLVTLSSGILAQGQHCLCDA
jgi:hypothetical protein